MHVLSQWSASRSGAYMRVTGIDRHGKAQKITAKLLNVAQGKVRGIDRDDNEFELTV